MLAVTKDRMLCANAAHTQSARISSFENSNVQVLVNTCVTNKKKNMINTIFIFIKLLRYIVINIDTKIEQHKRDFLISE